MRRKKMYKCHLVAAHEEKSLARFNLLDASQISVDRSRGSRDGFSTEIRGLELFWGEADEMVPQHTQFKKILTQTLA